MRIKLEWGPERVVFVFSFGRKLFEQLLVVPKDGKWENCWIAVVFMNCPFPSRPMFWIACPSLVHLFAARLFSGQPSKEAKIKTQFHASQCVLSSLIPSFFSWISKNSILFKPTLPHFFNSFLGTHFSLDFMQTNTLKFFVICFCTSSTFSTLIHIWIY